MHLRYKVMLGIALVVLALAFLSVTTRLPDNSQRTSSRVINDGDSTRLGTAFKTLLAQHPGQSGVHLLSNGLDAFVGRAALAGLAERSIDVQYYMFHQDTVGRLLLKELVTAADREVRVRILIDDIYGDEADDVWTALDAHPNVEVRLFNPFVRGRSKTLQFITRLRTVNHRMHSKTFTVDNQATIVGGRNIGDEYFDADPNLAFADMDALTIGPVVPVVSQQFDQYWNSRHAYPVSTLVTVAKTGAMDQLRNDLIKFYHQKTTSVYVDALENSAFAESLRQHSATFSFAEAKVIHDSPEKLARSDDWTKELLMSQLAPYIKQATEEFILVSPYFVPGQHGADELCRLSEQGVRVQVLTNSLASNDVAAVHTGYIRHREQLLRCGVELYELNEEIKKQEGERFTWLPGLNKSSLHAKTMAIDEKAMFVGSFNFDQRSLKINNEIGILFHEPQMASDATKHFNDHIERVAFKVKLVDGDALRWTGMVDGDQAVFNVDPYTGFWTRLGVTLMRVLPIDYFL